MEKLVCSLGKSLENSGNFFSYPVDAECYKKSCSDCYTIQNHRESAELSSRHSIIDCKNCTRHFFAWPSAACCTVQWAIHTCYYSSVEYVYIFHCFQDITVSLFTLLLVMWNHSSAIAVKITAMCGMLLIRKLIIADVWCFLALTYAILSLVNLTMINRKIFVNWAPDFYTSCILTMCFCLYPVAANDGNR